MQNGQETARPLTPSQVARLFNVSVTTVGKWADAGLIRSFRTPGGQRRFHEADIAAAIATELVAPRAGKAS